MNKKNFNCLEIGISRLNFSFIYVINSLSETYYKDSINRLIMTMSMSNSDNDLKRKVKEEISDEEESTVSVPLPAKRSKDCPYLDSINRKVLDFGT